MNKNGVDYRRAHNNQESTIALQVIDEVSLAIIISVLMCIDAEKPPTIHWIGLRVTLRNIDWRCD